jgi:hypothetical protein
VGHVVELIDRFLLMAPKRHLEGCLKVGHVVGLIGRFLLMAPKSHRIFRSINTKQ